MSSPLAVTSVIVAAAQSVGKVFVIGAVGYFAVLFPRKAPLLPPEAVSTVARFSFNALLIPLIFSTIGSSVTVSSLSDNWFVLVGAVCVMAISYMVATGLAFILPISNPRDYCALRIAVTFPNVVGLPILVFPSLCEYPVVYEAFGSDGADNVLSDAEMSGQCNARSNTMVFVYFFGWSFIFYSFGHRILMNAAIMEVPDGTRQSQTRQHNDTSGDLEDDEENTHPSSHSEPGTEINDNTDNSQIDNSRIKESLLGSVWRATKQTLASPPFIAMVLAFIVGCIAPVRDLLFSQSGALRFLGGALETLGRASSSITTMVVAASLVPPREIKASNIGVDEDHNPEDNNPVRDHVSQIELESCNHYATESAVLEESPVMSDPTFGPYQLRQRRSTIKELSKSISRNSLRFLTKVHRTPPEITRMHVWFTLSRLILAPAVVVAVIVGMDCGGWLRNVPDLAKLVLIVNSAVPGASTVVVLLKSNSEMHETASVLAKAYLPSYIISVVTIAAWTALALYISIPDEIGSTFCHR